MDPASPLPPPIFASPSFRLSFLPISSQSLRASRTAGPSWLFFWIASSSSDPIALPLRYIFYTPSLLLRRPTSTRPRFPHGVGLFAVFAVSFCTITIPSASPSRMCLWLASSDYCLSLSSSVWSSVRDSWADGPAAKIRISGPRRWPSRPERTRRDCKYMRRQEHDGFGCQRNARIGHIPEPPAS